MSVSSRRGAWALAALCALTLLGSTFAQAAAQEKSWEITSFAVDIALDVQGGVAVTETLDVAFVGSWNGILRWIPVVENREQWSRKHLDLHMRAIRDGYGAPLRYEESTQDDYRKFKIYVPGAENATRRVVISYDVADVARSFDDHDELYWNVTGNEWPVPIDRAAATITVPSAAAGQLRTIAYTGPYGAQGSDYHLEVNQNVVSVETTKPLQYKEGLTVAIGLPKGVITGPGPVDRARRASLQYAILLLPIGVFLGYFAVWRRIGKDPQLARSVMVRYEPPEGLSPAEVGALVDGRVDQRDVAALLVDLAVRGYLRIEETEDVTAWVFRRRSYTFHRVQEGPWAELRDFERAMLDGLFRGGADSVELSKLTNRFYTSLRAIQSDIYSGLTQRGYFRLRPDWVKSGTGTLMVIALVGSGLLAGASVLKLDANPLVAGGAALVTVAIVFFFNRIMPALTQKGAEARLEALGFEEFLGRAERERLKLATPETFEAYLPYAMALRVEEQWAAAFEGIKTQPPRWYAGHSSSFAPGSFTRSLTSMSDSATATFASAPRSSGGSGFGGGGGSGGGSGGGGGGAF